MCHWRVLLFQRVVNEHKNKHKEIQNYPNIIVFFRSLLFFGGNPVTSSRKAKSIGSRLHSSLMLIVAWVIFWFLKRSEKAWYNRVISNLSLFQNNWVKQTKNVQFWCINLPCSCKVCPLSHIDNPLHTTCSCLCKDSHDCCCLFASCCTNLHLQNCEEVS